MSSNLHDLAKNFLLTNPFNPSITDFNNRSNSVIAILNDGVTRIEHDTRDKIAIKIFDKPIIEKYIEGDYVVLNFIKHNNYLYKNEIRNRYNAILDCLDEPRLGMYYPARFKVKNGVLTSPYPNFSNDYKMLSLGESWGTMFIPKQLFFTLLQNMNTIPNHNSVIERKVLSWLYPPVEIKDLTSDDIRKDVKLLSVTIL